MFFFEKKNQKTSPPWSPVVRSGLAPKRLKVFCFFFSKKKILPS
jgi:hypothetical protein